MSRLNKIPAKKSKLKQLMCCSSAHKQSTHIFDHTIAHVAGIYPLELKKKRIKRNFFYIKKNSPMVDSNRENEEIQPRNFDMDLFNTDFWFRRLIFSILLK